MSGPSINALVTTELAATNWPTVIIVKGRDPERVPKSVMRLVSATSRAAAEEAYRQLDDHVVVQGMLTQGAVLIVPALMAALAGPLAPPARRAIAGFLAGISAAESPPEEVDRGHSDHGPECRRLITEGTWLVYGLLLDPDPLTRAWGLRIAHAVDGDRARVGRMSRRSASEDPDPQVRQAAQELLAGMGRTRVPRGERGFAARSVLLAAGWYPGRAVPVEPHVAALEADGYVVWPALVELIREYAGLTVTFQREGGEDSIWFDPARATESLFRDHAEIYERRLQTLMAPVGYAHTDHMVVLAAEAGPVYGAFDHLLWELGNSPLEAIDAALITESGRPVP